MPEGRRAALFYDYEKTNVVDLTDRGIETKLDLQE